MKPHANKKKPHAKKRINSANLTLDQVLASQPIVANALFENLPLSDLLEFRKTSKTFNNSINNYLITELSIKQIACGESHSVILLKNGRVLVMGENKHGQLGLGSGKPAVYLPTELTGINKIKQIGATGWGTSLLTVNKELWVMGWNFDGNLGLDKNEKEVFYPKKIENLKVKRLETCHWGNLVKNDQDEIHCFGSEIKSVFINGRRRAIVKSLKIPDNKPIKDIAFGPQHCLYVTQNKQVYGTGSNINKQLGLGDAHYTGKNNWVRVYENNRNEIKQIGATSLASFILTANGELIVSGFNNCGQLGEEKESKAFHLATNTKIKNFAANDFHTLLLTQENELQAMGNSECGLGLGKSIQNVTTPMSVLGFFRLKKQLVENQRKDQARQENGNKLKV